MFKFRSVLLSLLTTALVAGFASPGSTGEDSPRIGRGVDRDSQSPRMGGKEPSYFFRRMALLFRSGDTHPVLSRTHGAWKRVGDREFEMPPISRFDSMKTESGSEAPRPGYTLSLALETTSSRAWTKSAHATCRITRLGRPKCVFRENVSRLNRSDIALYSVMLAKVRRSVAF